MIALPSSTSERPAHRPAIRSDYLNAVVDPRILAVTIKRTAEYLRRLQFDAIAFRGMSGALIAPSLAMELGKTILMVRKEGDSTHSCYEVEGDINAQSYVIIDDFMSCGHTASGIIDALRRHVPGAYCLGIFEYDHICQSYSATKELKCGTTISRLSSPGVLLTDKEVYEVCLRYPLS